MTQHISLAAFAFAHTEIFRLAASIVLVLLLVLLVLLRTDNMLRLSALLYASATLPF